jgi:hypothetical protein
MKNKLRKLAKEARERRLESRKKDSTESPLHSYCFDNSFVVYSVSKENGFNPKIVEGTTEWYADSLIQNGVDLDELDSTKELAGDVHYWVEVNGYIIDISSHTKNKFGEILVTDNLPDSYYRFEDSYKEGSKTLNNALNRICSYCGGRKNYCNCSKND